MILSMLRRLVWVAPILAAFVLAGCSTTGGGLARFSEPDSPYGDYLIARYASSESDVKSAAKHYALALKSDPDNKELRQRTMMSAMFAGDISAAAKQARTLLEVDANDRMAVLIAASDAMAKRRYSVAEEILQDAQLGPLNQIAADVLYGYALQGLDRTDEAVSKLREVEDLQILGDLAIFHRALVLADAGRTAEANGAFQEAMDTRILTSRTAWGWASWQMQQGKFEDARELVSTRLEANPFELEAKFLLAKLDENAKAPKPFAEPRQGAAEALFGHAQVLAERSLRDWAVIYLELSLHMDPHNGAAQDLLGRLYQGQHRSEDAMALLAQVREDDPWYLQAEIDAANMLFENEKAKEAISRLRVLGEKYSDVRIQRALARALQFDKQYEPAFELFDQLIKQDEEAADWQLYYSRAICLERTERWQQAIPDFRKALELNPEQADVLNYLGYTFVDAGENLEEGFALIRQAIELRPQAGYIVDSLGWGHYRMGDYEKAVEELERAVVLEPGEPTINDHLGDAYWQVGRKLEAKYQWQRVLSLQPDDDVDLAEINAKIRRGLAKKDPEQLAQDS
jgi:tetratricopeptide (TPR) repeat protein